MQPMTIIPEIAFVTDISGVCNDGATPQITIYPIIQAKTKTKKLKSN